MVKISYVSASALSLVLAGLLTGATTSLWAQSIERQVIVSAVDDDGGPVPGLTTSDFVVREDGTRREVLRVAPASDERQIAVLVDTSQAARSIVGDLRRGVESFVEAMSDGNEMSLISFGGTPRILTESTSSLTRLQDGVGNIFTAPDSAAYLLDAVRETTEGFARRGAERPVIVVLATRGLDYSTRDATQVLDQLAATGTALYSVVFERRVPQLPSQSVSSAQIDQTRIQRDRLLDAGPKETGGRTRYLQSASAAVQVMQDVANDLRNQYLLVYARPDTFVPPEVVEVVSARSDVDARGTLVLNADGS